MTKIKIPSRQEVLDFLGQQERPIIRRDIARAFHLKGPARITLKELLKELLEEGLLFKKGKRYQLSHSAEYKTLRFDHITDEGDLIAVPVDWSSQEPTPLIYIRPSAKTSRLKIGDTFYAQLHFYEENTYEASVVRLLEKEKDTFLAVFYPSPSGGFLYPIDRKDRLEYHVSSQEAQKAHKGDIVEAVPGRQTRRESVEAQIIRVLGSMNEPKAVSLLAIKQWHIPFEFKPETLEEAKKAPLPVLEGRDDLREFPLVTIDDEDARDFDDAVWAEPDTDPQNPQGWHMLVAIADVSFYVKPHSSLDQEAYERGNSVYFPDRVVPMLPEALSNELCSLKPDEDRACLAVHLWINAEGHLIRHRFVRGLMRSTARLTYLQVQRAIEGQETSLSPSFIKKVIKPLYGAYKCLQKAREERGPLELESTELRVHFSQEGKVAKVTPRLRFDSHRLIEEMMILANVAAAITLTDHNHLGMFRVHDVPPVEKIEILGDYLKMIGLKFSKGQNMRPKQFNHILEKAKGTPYAKAVQELVLRSQAQAVYSPDNIGHYGLNLPRYCHFTSPIRRYADLLVHRALTVILKKAPQEEYAYTHAQLTAIGDHISETERRAASAERDTLSRYLADYFSDKIGECFKGHISGVTRYALFVSLEAYGVDGILLARDLTSDYFIYDEKRHHLKGRRTQKIYALGNPIEVKILESSLFTGRLLLGPAEEEELPKKKVLKRVPFKKNQKRAGKRR